MVAPDGDASDAPALLGNSRHTRFDIDRAFIVLHNGGNVEEPMATLNIKNVPDRLYRKIQTRANKKHRSVAQEVVHILTQATEGTETLSILELQGLGKELWREVDGANYVKKERREWD